MDQQTFEMLHDVKLINKKDDPLMRFVGFFSKKWFNDFWNTYRLPFGKPIIVYPPSVKDPMKYMGVLEHELIHVEDIRSGWGLFKSFWLVWLLPLPILFSGRWFVERNAYLHDIKKGRLTIEQSVDMLWNSYGYAWPKPLMRNWFEEQLKK